MRASWLAIGLLLAAALVALWWFGRAEPAAVVLPEPEVASMAVADRSHELATTEPEREVVTVPAQAAEGQVEAPVEELKVVPQDDRHALWLTFREAVSGRLLPGFELDLEQGSVQTSVVAGEDGRARTAPLFEPGEIPVELESISETEPSLWPPWEIEPESLLVEFSPHRVQEVLVTVTPTVLTLEVQLDQKVTFHPGDPPRIGFAMKQRDEKGRLLGGGRTGFGPVDDRGRSVFHLHGDEPLTTSLVVELVDVRDGWVADPLILDPLLTAGPHLLGVYRGGELRVRVVEADGTPVSGVDVMAFARHQYNAPSRTTGEDGTAVFEALHAGRYEVSAPGADRSGRVDVDMPRGVDHAVELVLKDPDDR